MNKLKVKKLHPDARLPKYAHSDDAGMDLCASEEMTVPAHGYAIVPTGIAVKIVFGYAGLIWDKSGLAAKGGLTVLAGVIDSGYRGEVKVVIHNTTDTPYAFSAGDKVAQMLIQQIAKPDVVEVEELDKTTRNKSGFGSTGK